MLVRAVVLICVSVTALAQPTYFGGRVPLTNTRYAAGTATPLLTAHGAVQFWSAAHNVRMSLPGQQVARPLLDGADGDAVWSGTRYLVAASSANALRARFVDATGNAGETFTLADPASGPRLARDGDRLLMLYRNGNGIQWATVTDAGASDPQPLAASARDYDLVANAALLATDDGVKLLKLDGNGNVMSEARVSDAAERVALASDGRDFLALWSRGGAVEGAFVRENGTIETPFAVASGASAMSLAWNGSAYQLAYDEKGTPRVVDVPASMGLASFRNTMIAANEQSLAGTASTANAALVVWNERGDARIGLRTQNGAWRERLLATGERAVDAATDGIGFIVVTQNDDGWVAALLDESGTTLRQSPRVPFTAHAVASTASGHAVIGTNGGAVVAARVNPDGSVLTPVTLQADAGDPAIASDGASYLAVWETAAKAIEGVRLSPDAQRLDAEDIALWESNGEDPAAGFNGDRYVVAFRSGTYVKARRVTREGAVVMELVQTGRVDGDGPRDIGLTRVGEQMAVTWWDHTAQVLMMDGQWDVQTSESFPARSGSAPRLVVLPGGGVAMVQGDLADDAPHHGSARLVFAYGDTVQPASVPEAPRADVVFERGMLLVHWTPSPGASGYRLEYRIDGGPWLEHEGWSDGSATSAAIDPDRVGRYEVRVRAWGNGGVSAYSEGVEVTVSGRRRAVR